MHSNYYNYDNDDADEIPQAVTVSILIKLVFPTKDLRTPRHLDKMPLDEQLLQILSFFFFSGQTYTRIF